MDISNWQFDPDKESAMSALGFKPYTPEISTRLAQVSAGGAGESSGLIAGDRIDVINGEKIDSWQQIVDAIRGNPNKSLTFDVIRDGQTLSLTLVPQSKALSDGSVIGFAGIAPEVAEWPQNYRFDLQFGVFESIGKAIDKTGQVIGLTMTMLKKLVVGDVGLENLSGPISIAKGAGTTADYGLVYFLGFLALISVNLGIINLVPLPMLDGGHLLFLRLKRSFDVPSQKKFRKWAIDLAAQSYLLLWPWLFLTTLHVYNVIKGCSKE
ncbi:RIP metalloprotease RseP [Vibrio taketomensis]|uniref:RIP metalloprotease RseP n=1 Tax=Vibrio taketomensis TaxID=2572923 RepID=UPI001E5C3EEE|nr:RIP metalloprotease RseP [Vibrio taketomensis]